MASFKLPGLPKRRSDPTQRGAAIQRLRTRALAGSLAAAALIMTASGAAAAASSNADVSQQVTVRYDDLNLDRRAGAVKLYTRLRHAAWGVCGAHPGPNLVRWRMRQECYAGALDEAVRQVDHPAVAALHRPSSTRLVPSARADDRSMMR